MNDNIFSLNKESAAMAQPGYPRPLLQDSNNGLEYPVSSLGKILSPAAAAIIECAKVPDAIAAQSILAAAALVVQGFANIEVDGRIYPLSLFALTIAESGDRKSAADAIALKPHSDAQKAALENYQNELNDYNKSLIAYEVEINNIKKLKGVSQDERSKLLKETIEPQPPLNPTLIVQEPSLEGLQKSFEIGISSQGLFNDEGGQFFGGYAMNTDNALKSMAGISKLWDGKEITRTRASESITLYDKRLSVHLMAQPIVAEKVLRDPVLQGQGFIPRFLLSWPVSIAGSRFYERKNALEDPRIINYIEVMGNLINKALSNENLRMIELSDNAMSLWIEAHDDIERKLGQNGEFADIKATGSKAADNILRIAGVLSLVENPETKIIKEEHMFNAITLGAYYQYEALRLTTENKLNLVLPRAQYLLDWLQDLNKNFHRTIFSTRDIYRNAPHHTKIKSKREPAMELISVLVEYGWLIPASEGTMINGKQCKEAWILQTSPYE